MTYQEVNSEALRPVSSCITHTGTLGLPICLEFNGV
jgi:hypothetical protein